MSKKKTGRATKITPKRPQKRRVVTISEEDAAKLLTLLERTQISGSEAPDFMRIIAALQRPK